ncbi:MAG: type II toxin-antitoxin system PemK/MazF family toxin [Geminicoccales bacterium]
MKRGDVVLVALRGDYGKPRPAVILQNDLITAEESDSVIVCPMTSHVSGMKEFRVLVEPAPDNGLRSRSEVMVEKLAGVPRRRLRDVIGRLDAEAMQAVEQASLLVLGFA